MQNAQNICILMIGIIVGLLSVIIYAIIDICIKKRASQDGDSASPARLRKAYNISFLLMAGAALLLCCIVVYFSMPYIYMEHFKLCQTLKSWTIAVTLMAVYEGVIR